MKRLLILTTLFFSLAIVQAQTYNPAAHTVTNKALGIAQATPTDARSYFYDPSLFVYRPYQNTAEVLSYLNLTKYRVGNFPIFVNVGGTLQSGGTFVGGNTIEYWFKDGTAGTNLVYKAYTDSAAVAANLAIYNKEKADSATLRALINSNTTATANNSTAIAAAFAKESTDSGTLKAFINSNIASISANATAIANTYTKAETDARYMKGLALPTTAAMVAYTGINDVVLVTDTIAGGQFYYSTATLTDDNAVYFPATGKGTGHWVRNYDKSKGVNVAWWGNDAAAIQKAVNFAGVGGIIHYQPRKRYIIDRGIYLINGQQHIGELDTLQRANEFKAVLTSAIAISPSPHTFTVNDASGFAVGNDLMFYSATVNATATHRIIAISGNTITTDAQLTYAEAFAVGDTVITEFGVFGNPLGGGPYLKGIKLSGFVFDGNRANNTSHLSWIWNAMVDLYVDNGVVENCEFYNSKADGLIIGGINPVVNHCRFENGNSNGVHLSGSNHPVITNNFFRALNQNTGTGHNEGDLTFSDLIINAELSGNYFGQTPLAGVGSLDNPVSGNTDAFVNFNIFDSCTQSSFGAGNGVSTTPHLYNYTFNNNIIKNCGRGGFGGVVGTSTALDVQNRFVATGNLFVNSPYNLGVCNNVLFSNNMFFKESTGTITQNYWMYIRGLTSSTISGNHFVGHIYGIYVDATLTSSGPATTSYVNVENNTFFDQTNASIYTQTGGGTAYLQGFIIKDNLFRCSTGGAANIASKVVFKNNEIYSTSTNSAFVAVTAQTFSGGAYYRADSVMVKGNTFHVSFGQPLIFHAGGFGNSAIDNSFDPTVNPLSNQTIVDSATNTVLENNRLIGYKYSGTATLASGTATVTAPAVQAGSNIEFYYQSCSSCGTLYKGTVVAGTSFVINSTNASDASLVFWRITK